MSHRVYFVQPVGGGPVKIGSTVHMDSRLTGMGTMSHAPLELVATIPGFRCREAVLHFLLEPARLHGEWFKAGPAIWRLMLDAIEAGDLAWLPHPTDDDIPAAGVAKAAMKARFGKRQGIADALGYRFMPPTDAFLPNTRFWGRFQGASLLADGLVPGYIADLHRAAAPLEEAA